MKCGWVNQSLMFLYGSVDSFDSDDGSNGWIDYCKKS